MDLLNHEWSTKCTSDVKMMRHTVDAENEDACICVSATNLARSHIVLGALQTTLQKTHRCYGETLVHSSERDTHCMNNTRQKQSSMMGRKMQITENQLFSNCKMMIAVLSRH